MRKTTMGLATVLALLTASSWAADPEDDASDPQDDAKAADAEDDAEAEEADDADAEEGDDAEEADEDAEEAGDDADAEEGDDVDAEEGDDAEEKGDDAEEKDASDEKGETVSAPALEMEVRDVAVISDLDMGLGRDSSGRWFPTEDFRWTRALDGYLNQLLARGEAVDLVINGGLLDLWQVPEGLDCTGPDCDEAQMAKVAEAIVDAHALDLALLGRFAKLSTNQVYVLPGAREDGLKNEAVWTMVVDAMNEPVDLDALAALQPEREEPAEAPDLLDDEEPEPEPEPAEESEEPDSDPLGDVEAKVTLLADGPYVSADGQVAIEPGHQWTPDEATLHRLIASQEAERPLIDNLRPVSRGSLALEPSDEIDAGQLADYLVQYSLSVAPTHRLRTLETDAEDDAPEWQVKKARKRGHLLFVDQLEPDMPARELILNAEDPRWSKVRGSLKKAAKGLDDAETMALCDLTATHKVQFAGRGAYPRCPGKNHDSLKIAEGRAQLVSGVLADDRPSNALTTYITAASHAPVFGWDVALDDLGREKVTVYNTGAFQRAADPQVLRQLAAQLADVEPTAVREAEVEAALAGLDPRHLPACYQTVIVDFDGGVAEPRLKNWYLPDDAQMGELREPCDRECGFISPQCR